MGPGVADPTGQIALNDPTHIILAPGVYWIAYDVSALLSEAAYMQVTPYYNDGAHIEYGIYFMTGTARSSAHGSINFMIEVPARTVFSLTFNSPAVAREGVMSMVIFKLERDSA